MSCLDKLYIVCAYRAFKALAYKRYQHVPIYLEWAPANIFSADAPRLQPGIKAVPETAATTAASGSATTVDTVDSVSAAALPDIEDAETSTIYVKNLAFATGSVSIKVHVPCKSLLNSLQHCSVRLTGWASTTAAAVSVSERHHCHGKHCKQVLTHHTGVVSSGPCITFLQR